MPHQRIFGLIKRGIYSHIFFNAKLISGVIFEGRDAAGQGGTIKRNTERLNPRVCHVAALPAPTEREKTQWYSYNFV